MNKTVSVVLPVYNGDDYLRESIESVVDQTYTDWELLIIDDGSTDDTAKIAREYADADERLERLLATNPRLRAEFDENFKIRNDPRVTPLGRFLRRMSLDEIPQIFNVFAGQMSFVGPRPIVAAEVPYYGEDYDTFSRVRPGVTGLWQCSGRSDTGYDRRVALDIYYALNWSPWMDIWICIRTVFSGLLMRGAA